MTMSAQALKDKSRNIAKQNRISVQEVLQNYMFERILERLSVSRYKDNFILKGGLLLSSIVGIDIRTTMDMDTTITGIALDKLELKKILTEILNIELNDNIKFEITGVQSIKEEDYYGGYNYKIIAIFENIKVILNIDISTGDVITPGAIEYSYKTLFDNRTFGLLTYNYETIIAEKFQTVMQRANMNSRMKDYYDIYYFVNKKWESINKELLVDAIIKTFLNRNSIQLLKTINETLEDIKNNKLLDTLWENYKNKHSFARDIKYEATVNSLCLIKNLLFDEKYKDLIIKYNIA